MCNYSICAVYKGLFPLSVPYLFILGAKNFQYSNHLCFPSLSPLTEGCPGLCNSNGRCTLDQNGWHCVCQPGWRGAGCDVAMETLCTDSKDNEGGKKCWAWKQACATAQVYKLQSYLVPKKSDPHRFDRLKNVWVLIEWFCSLFSLKQMRDYYHSGKRQGNQATV